MIQRRTFASVLIALVAAPTVLAQLAPASPAPPAGALTGVVYDATTSQPVAGAIVTLARLDGGPLIPRAVTDSRGRFVFRNLEPSTQYYLGARRFGYEYTRYGWTGPNQSLTIADIARITIAPNQWLDGIRIPLWRTGSISGRVTDEHGEPLVGVAVRVFSFANISGQRQLVAGDIATTDDLGMYRIGGLRPGSYSVAVLSVQSTVLQSTQETASALAVGQLATGGIGSGRGPTVSMPAIDVDGTHRLVVTNFATPPPPAAGQARAYPPTFHPGAVVAADATQIDIGFSDSRTGIDIQVRPVAAVRVAGRLTTPSGEAAPPLLLRLMPAGAERLGFGSEAATTTVGSDGTFVFLNVPAGTYTLMAQASVMDFTSGTTSRRFPDAPGFPAGGISVGSVKGAPGLSYLARHGASSEFWGRTAVTVGARDVGDVVVPMRRTSTIRGRLVLPDKFELPPGAHLNVRVEPADGDPTMGQGSGAIDVAQADRPFTIQGLMGASYLVSGFSTNQPALLSSLRIASVTWQGRDVRYSGIDTANTEDVRDVVITLTDQKIEIKGIASAPQPPPAPPASAQPFDYAPIYFPGTSAIGQAAPIVLAAGQSQGGLVFSLQRVPTATVAGLVTRPDGMPGGGASLQLTAIVPPGPFRGNARLELNATAAPDGTFRIAQVTPGAYQLVARVPVDLKAPGVRPGYIEPPSTPQLYAVADVFVSGGDITGLGLGVTDGVRVSGRFVFESDARKPPASLAGLRVTLVPESLLPLGPGRGVSATSLRLPSPAVSRADGTFEFGGVAPGRYQVLIGASGIDVSGWQVAAAVAGDRDVLDGLLEIAPGGSPRLLVTYDDRPTKLSGRIETQSGAPAPDVLVIVFAADRAQWGPYTRRVKVTRPGADGSFTFEGLPAGAYHLAALTDADPEDWQDPAFLEQLIPASVRVLLTGGQPVVQGLRIGR